MALKTFNLDAEVYKEFSKHCKENGISMSKKVENFIRDEVSKIKPKRARVKNKEDKKMLSSEHHSFSKYC